MKAIAPLVFLVATTLSAAPPDWSAVAQALGKSGAVQGDVYRVSFPRSDLAVTVDGVRIRPALALGSWVAMKPIAGGVLVMGDLVLTEDEAPEVITRLQDGGVEQTALHNHLLHESPRTMYLHIGAHGDAVTLARTIHRALEATKTPFAAGAASGGEGIDLPTADLDAAIGAKGKPNGGVYQFSVPRKETIRSHGTVIPPPMGVATAINFQPTGSGRAVATGDFVLLASEVNPVIRELTRGGIQVTALHSHMLDESPRLFFMHFWGNGDARKLAATLGAALARPR